MFKEKMVYYRKKNMMTQEDLAECLCVSRQTITKWESGDILPSLEYLINLSDIFHVTIDSLVKEDDCIALEQESIDYDLASFLVKAKQSTYASKQNKIQSSRLDSHDYAYEDENYRYIDSFFGSSLFSGQEIVYHKDKVCWSMNYYGKVLNNHFSGDFLKEALLQVKAINPLRGPDIYQQGEYTYVCHVDGDKDMFCGTEDIYYQSTLVYQGYFHGGMIM